MTTRVRAIRALLCALILLPALLVPAAPAHAATFTVNDNRDLPDAVAGGVCDVDVSTGGFQCTLRAAIQLANASAGPHAITLPADTYTLTQTGADDTALDGDLDILQNITIVGGGAAITIVQASTTDADAGIDRVFDVRPGGSLTMSGVTIRNGLGTGSASPGGINNAGTLVLDGVVVSGNKGPAAGGIVSFVSPGTTTLTIRNSTISGNTSTSSVGVPAGALFLQNTNATITNSTISGNLNAGTSGTGGIVTNPGVTLSANNVTVANNGRAGPNPGGLLVSSGSATLRNSLFANNVGPACGTAGGSITSGGFNLVFPNGGSTAANCNFAAGTNDVIGQDPMLGLLARNGAQTLTHRLLPGSPAVDRANNVAAPGSGGNACEAADQRGVPRPLDGNADGTRRCDVGAYELGTETAGDVAGDDRSDAGVWIPSSGFWFAIPTGGGSAISDQFGGPTDIPVPADYDGDGRVDFAIFFASTGRWFAVLSGGGVVNEVVGAAGQIPVPADYDGDGKADLATYNPNNGGFFALRSDRTGVIQQVLGAGGDVPVPADYDGDGRADPAVFIKAQGRWFAVLSTGGILNTRLGANGQIPVPADYDGDARADVATYNPANGTFFAALSDGGTLSQAVGAGNDFPIPADYDLDGRADLGVYNRTNGVFFAVLTGGGVFNIQVGNGGHIPLQKRPGPANTYPY